MVWAEFEIGDRVELSDWLIEAVGTNLGTINCHFCEYGEHMVGIDFDNGKYKELNESVVQKVLTDHYEYTVTATIGDHTYFWYAWGTLSEAEDSFLHLMYLEEQNSFIEGRESATYKLVKRRKAGKVENVEI